MITPNTKFWTHDELLGNLIKLINLVEGDDGEYVAHAGLQEAYDHAVATLKYARQENLPLPNFSDLNENK